MFDDSDVKIFNDEADPEESFDEVALIAEMKRHRSNGNSEKAKKLGKHLADIFIDETKMIKDLSKEVGSLDFDEDTIYQIKVLLAFTAEYCINHSLPSPLLSNTAVNKMYDTVKANAFDFYDRLDDVAEYSFYYLALRKGTQISEEIGKAFAKICDNPDFAGLGKNLFEFAKREIESIIDLYEFE